MLFTKKELKEAVSVAASLTTSTGSNPILQCIRITRTGDQLIFIGCDGSNVISWYAKPAGLVDIDVCIHAKRIKAIVDACHAKEKILFKQDDGKIKISQENGPKSSIAVASTRDFPPVPGFDGMEHVYHGPNPKRGLDALRHDALTNAGSTPLYGVVVFTPGASYAMRAGVTVRCEFSLLDRETELSPIPVPMDGTNLLRHFGEEIRCMADESRFLIISEQGYAVMRRSAIDVGVFPEEARLIFGSLRARGDIRVTVAKALPVTRAIVSVLGSVEPHTPLYLTLESAEETVTISGMVGEQSYAESIPAVCTGHYKIPVPAERLLSFLKSSGDDQVAIRVMDSPKIPDPLRFVHLVDSRLHEVVGIARGKVEELKGEVSEDA